MDVNESDQSPDKSRPTSNVVESNDGTSRHVSKSKSSWGLSTAVHSVGFVAKKVVNNRLTDSLWHSRKDSSSSSDPSNASSSAPNAKADNQSHEAIDHHTTKPLSIVADEETANLPVSSNNTHEIEKNPSEISKNLDGSPVNQHRGPSASDVIDELENLNPQDGSHVSTIGSSNIDPSEDSKPTANLHVIDQSVSMKHVKPVNQHPWPSTSGSNVWPTTTASNFVDQSGSLKPRDSSHVKLVHQHRWPSRSSSHVVDQSENIKPRDGSQARPTNQHRWPGTVGSNVLNKGIKQFDEAIKLAPNLRKTSASKPAKDTSSDDTNTSTSSHVVNGRLNIDDSIHTQPSSPRKVSPASKEASVTPSIRGLICPTPSSGGDNAIRVDPPTVSKEVNLSISTNEVDPSLVTRGLSHSLGTKEVCSSLTTTMIDPTPMTRVSGPIPLTIGASLIPMSRSASPPHDFHTPMPSSPRESSNSNTVSISTEGVHIPNKQIGHTPPSHTTRDVSPGPSDGATSPTHTARAVSPTSIRGVSPPPNKGVSHRVRGVIPSLTKPSSTKHFFKSNILSIFSKITDVRKEKNVSNHIEDSKYLELLQNIQVQWQFANASAEDAFDLRRVTAKKSLLDAWRTILELRDSVAAKKVDSVLLILQLKLHAVLYRQMAFIDEWASIQSEYEYALSVTTNDLQARSLSVPINGGVKADIKDLKLVVFSTVQVLQATTSRIQSTLSKLDKTHFLASELANVALHERALLDECEIFLASTTPLQIEECSLRSYLIQTSRTSISEQ